MVLGPPYPVRNGICVCKLMIGFHLLLQTDNMAESELSPNVGGQLGPVVQQAGDASSSEDRLANCANMGNPDVLPRLAGYVGSRVVLPQMKGC